MQLSAAQQEVESRPWEIRLAVPSMAPIAAHLIYLTMGRVADHLFGNGQREKAQVVLGRLFESRQNVFSHQLADAVLENGEPVGLLMGAPWHTMERLRLPTALRVIRTSGLATLLQLVARSAPFASAREAEDDEYFVAHLAILPEFQGLRLGTLLMAHAEEKARHISVTKLALTVGTENHRAISFYRRLGFEIVGTRKFPALEARIGYAGFHRMRKSLL